MNYFGTDGIRGIPNVNLNVDLLTRLGMALSSLKCKEVYIATDTRLSKDYLLSALSTGILAMGMNVHYLGVASTPCLIYHSYIKQAIGVMITASHNPYQDNGIKIINKGYKLTKFEEETLESLINKNEFNHSEVGVFKFEDNLDIYLDFLNTFIDKYDLKLVIDCAHGATYKIAQDIFNKISDNVTFIGVTPNGMNINQDVGSTHVDNLIDTVLNKHCDLGVAFDGDGDRIICVDKYGKVIDGDLIIYIIAKYLKEHNMLNKNYVVLSKMANLGVINALNKIDIEVKEVDVGDKYIYEELSNNNYSIGGEPSGHIIIPHLLHTGDGILIALYLLKILNEEHKTLDELIGNIDIYPSILNNITTPNKEKICSYKELLDYVSKIKLKLNNDVKILIRPSGTEDKLRIFVMSKYEETNKEIIKQILAIINKRV